MQPDTCDYQQRGQIRNMMWRRLSFCVSDALVSVNESQLIEVVVLFYVTSLALICPETLSLGKK